MTGVLVALLVVEVGLPLLAFLLRDRLMFFPSAAPRARDALPWVGPGVEAAAVEVARPDGRRLEALDGRPAGAAGDLPVLLFLHGNAGTAGGRAPVLGDLVRGTGARVLLPEYSGYGGNGGSPSEREAVADGLAAFDHLRAAGVPAGRIVLYGESLGGAVALAVAAERECAGVVLQSSFSSTASMAIRIYPWMPLAALLARGSFPSVDRIARLRAPVLVAHGERDSIVPLAEGRRLHAAAPPGAELLVVPGADHNDFLEVAGEAWLATLRERIRTWTSR
jgi:fermentation-respiration switch protein FrsA (DUF1100 family)